MYYLQSRYYNADWGRFINADEIAAVTGELLSANMFAYCKNNPTTLKDPSGFRPVLTEGEETDAMREASYKVMNTAARNQSSSSARGLNIKKSQLPTKDGVPNSKVKSPDGKQIREYDERGYAKRDEDFGHNHHHKELDQTKPSHYHDWDWDADPEFGARSKKPYQSIWEPILGAGLVVTTTVGMVWVVGNDITGIGVADDGALVPLGGGFAKGLAMFFGH